MSRGTPTLDVGIVEKNENTEREWNAPCSLLIDRSVQSVTAPVETTTSLEKLIVARIQDGRFDDVVVRGSGGGGGGGGDDNDNDGDDKLPELDETKGKGLAEVYEEQWLAAAGGGAEPGSAISSLQKLRDQASALFGAICSQIDALSHHAIGQSERGGATAAAADLEVKTIGAAQAAEEALPMVVSDAALAAPQELVSEQRAASNKAELTQEERRAERRRRKRQAKASGRTISGNTAAGKMALEMQKKRRRAKHDRKADDGKAVKLANSSRFFASLQEQVGRSADTGRQAGRQRVRCVMSFFPFSLVACRRGPGERGDRAPLGLELESSQGSRQGPVQGQRRKV